MTSRTSFSPTPPPLVEKNKVSSTIAEKSATDDPAMVVWPTGLSARPASLSTGPMRPSDVADSAIATSSGELTQFRAPTPAPIATPVVGMIFRAQSPWKYDGAT